MHKSAYGDRQKQASALLPVGIEAPPARENRKCIRKCIRIFADFGRKRPSVELFCLCPSLIPVDAQGGFCPCTPFFGPSDGLSSFQAMVVAIRFTPRRHHRQGFDSRAVAADEKNRPGDVIVFVRLRAVRGADALDGPFGDAFDIRCPPPVLRGSMVYKQSSAPYRRSESPFEDGVGQWTIQALLHISITLCVPYALRMQPYAVRMHFLGSSKKPMKSRDESTCKKPYALYAPLFGVGPFSGLFL